MANISGVFFIFEKMQIKRRQLLQTDLPIKRDLTGSFKRTMVRMSSTSNRSCYTLTGSSNHPFFIFDLSPPLPLLLRKEIEKKNIMKK